MPPVEEVTPAHAEFEREVILSELPVLVEFVGKLARDGAIAFAHQHDPLR